jgi:hypothetical protein
MSLISLTAVLNLSIESDPTSPRDNAMLDPIAIKIELMITGTSIREKGVDLE